MNHRELCLTRAVALGLALTLGACVESSQDRQRDSYVAGDTRYGDYEAGAADDGYDDASDDTGAPLPEYLEAPAYYSALWPTYHAYYDPWYAPDFYYGVTYFPSAAFGLGFDNAYAWPYYTAYSPYRYSPWDYYYVWYDGGGHHHRHHGHDHTGDDHHRGDHGRHHEHPHFGSDANEAERLALWRAGRRDQATAGWHSAHPGRYAGASGTPRPHGPATPPAQPAGGHEHEPVVRADGTRRGWQASPRRDGAVTGREASDAVAQAPPAAARGNVVEHSSWVHRGDGADRGTASRQARGQPRTGWIGPAPGARPVDGERGEDLDPADMVVSNDPRERAADAAPPPNRMSRMEAQNLESAAPGRGRAGPPARTAAEDPARMARAPQSMRAAGFVPASAEPIPVAAYRPMPIAPREGPPQGMAPSPYRAATAPAPLPSTARDAAAPGRDSSGGDDRTRGGERERK